MIPVLNSTKHKHTLGDSAVTYLEIVVTKDHIATHTILLEYRCKCYSDCHIRTCVIGFITCVILTTV